MVCKFIDRWSHVDPWAHRRTRSKSSTRGNSKTSPSPRSLGRQTYEDRWGPNGRFQVAAGLRLPWIINEQEKKPWWESARSALFMLAARQVLAYKAVGFILLANQVSGHDLRFPNCFFVSLPIRDFSTTPLLQEGKKPRRQIFGCAELNSTLRPTAARFPGPAAVSPAPREIPIPPISLFLLSALPRAQISKL